MAKSREYVYTIADIARLSGVSDELVRRHNQRGWFDPSDFASVTAYIHMQRSKGALRSGADKVG